MDTAVGNNHHLNGGAAVPGVPSIWGQPISVRSRRTNRWNNDVSTRATIEDLRRLAHQSAREPVVIGALADASQLLQPGCGHRAVANAIHHWVRRHIRFIEDEVLLAQQFGIPEHDLDKELLIVPAVLLRMPVPMGDCDDFSLLCASMCLCAGLQPYFVTVAADHTEPRRFSHVYVATSLPDERTHLCIDTGNRFTNVPAGWESHNVSRKAIWQV